MLPYWLSKRRFTALFVTMGELPPLGMVMVVAPGVFMVTL
jgi:hypothetical protein